MQACARKIGMIKIDMETKDWRTRRFKRGDSWRSTKVYECVVCETKTNYWVMGGWPNTGPRLICPYSHFDYDSPFCVLHNKIERFKDRLWDAEDDGISDSPLTKREVLDIRETISELMEQFRMLKPKDDVVIT